PIVVLVIWSALFLIAFIYSKCLREPQWVRIYDRCDLNTIRYQYIFRLIISRTREGFRPDLTTMSIRIVGQNNQNLCVFSIQPNVILTSMPTKKPGEKVVRLLIGRKHPLEKVTKVCLNHNGVGTIFVTNAEVQNVSQRKADIVLIQQFITKLDALKA